MLKDMTLGQFFPGNSLLHRLDPRTKLVLSLFYIVLTFLARTAEGFGVLLLFTLLLVALSRISLRILLRSLKVLLPILCITLLFTVLFQKGEHLLLSFWRVEIYQEGLIFAGFVGLRIVLLLLGTGVILTYTTSPIALTDGMERLLHPLSKLRLPVHEFSMMLSIALRFIPTLTEETDKIMNAQKARGASLDTGGLVRRAKALIPVLIPLFVSAFRRAEELATAMECRCYRGGKGRTRMTVTRFALRDLAVLLLFLTVGAGICLGERLPIGDAPLFVRRVLP